MKIKDYNKLLNKDKNLGAMISEIQREKDLKVDKLNQTYENKIDKLLRQKQISEKEIEIYKVFVKNN